MKAALRLNTCLIALALVIPLCGTGCKTKHPDKGITLIRTGPGSNIANPGALPPGIGTGSSQPVQPAENLVPPVPPIPLQPVVETTPVAPPPTRLVGETALPDLASLFGMIPDKNAFAPNTVFFDYDSASLKAKDVPKLKDVAIVLRNSPACKVVVDGHCDERGTEEYNRSLGERRALKVREQLIKEGISADRIYTRTYGKDVPGALGHDEGSWSQNRRGEFILLRPRDGAGLRTP